MDSYNRLVLLSTFSFALPVSAAPQHLLTIQGGDGGGGSSFPDFDEPFVYTLFYGGPRGPFPIPAWPIRYGELSATVLQTEGTTFLFNAANSPTFTEFAGLATNGTADDLLVNGVEVGGHSGYSSTTERSYWWRSGSSYQLDEVKLVIDYLTVAPDYTSFRTDYRWEFWGHEVPEPGGCTAGLVLFSAGLLRRRTH